ncbi:MAG: DUF3318 domain-containing protein [Cyanobacteriota bacterium]|nr:DUF3318 domain-containing protein [Cyanobacteriota bacterium]
MTSFADIKSFELAEIQRLRDLLPASLRPLLAIEAAPAYSSGALLGLKPRPPWQPNGVIQINFPIWQGIPQPQRDLLFLREAGWFDSRTWLQPGLYQAIATVGGIATLYEAVMHNPFALLLGAGVTGLAVKQIWQDLHSETVHFDADEFALQRAQFRGYDRQAAARHLLTALEQVQKLDRTDVLSMMRLQRLQAIAQAPPSFK